MDQLGRSGLIALCACDGRTLRELYQCHWDLLEHSDLLDILKKRYGSLAKAKRRLWPVYQRVRRGQAAAAQQEEQAEQRAEALCQRQTDWLERTKPHLHLSYEKPSEVTVARVDRAANAVHMHETDVPFYYLLDRNEWRGTHISRFFLRRQPDGSFRQSHDRDTTSDDEADA